MAEDISNYAQKLREEGIVVIENYLDEDKAGELKDKIEEKLADDEIEESDEGMGYDEKANYGKPVLDRREGDHDSGMIDIFNLEMEISSLQDIKDDEFIGKIINEATAQRFTPESFNVYYNRSVTNTRSFHADTYSGKFKAFIYLTDVPDESYGPTSYVPGSHKPSTLVRKFREIANKIRGKPSSDAIFTSKSDAKVVTGDKGTLIITNQVGLHRGIPQEEGKERMLINTQYTPPS